ncbi:MAG: DUF58 domain-containing protein [Betaproteobacteria bacterium]
MNLDRILRYSQLYNLVVRRKEPEAGTVYLSQRRVYILPSRQGLTFSLSLLVMLIGSINYNLSLGYLLTFLLAGVGIVSILHTFRNLAYLYISPGRAEPVFAGGEAHFQLHIENRGNNERFAIAFEREGVITRCDVPARDTVSVTIDVPATRRGLLALGRVTLDTRYPLGLLRAWSYVTPDLACLVYPRPDSSRLPPPQPQADSGDTIALGTGTDDFFGLRPYQASDSPRHIAWKASMREGPLLTKQFSGRAAAQMWFDWKSLPSGMEIEARLSRLARWVLLANSRGIAFGLRLPGLEMPMGLGDAHCLACLRELALFKTPGDAAPHADPGKSRP